MTPVANKRRTEVDAMQVTTLFKDQPTSSQSTSTIKNMIIAGCVFVVILVLAIVGVLQASKTFEI